MSNDTTCQLIDCDKPLKRGGYCYAHYRPAMRALPQGV